MFVWSIGTVLEKIRLKHHKTITLLLFSFLISISFPHLNQAKTKTSNSPRLKASHQKPTNFPNATKIYGIPVVFLLVFFHTVKFLKFLTIPFWIGCWTWNPSDQLHAPHSMAHFNLSKGKATKPVNLSRCLSCNQRVWVFLGVISQALSGKWLGGPLYNPINPMCSWGMDGCCGVVFVDSGYFWVKHRSGWLFFWGWGDFTYYGDWIRAYMFFSTCWGWRNKLTNTEAEVSWIEYPKFSKE